MYEVCVVNLAELFHISGQKDPLDVVVSQDQRKGSGKLSLQKLKRPSISRHPHNSRMTFNCTMTLVALIKMSLSPSLHARP